MSKIAVANANATFISSQGGSVTVTTLPSTNVRAGGAGVYRGPLNISIPAGAVSGSCIQSVPATGTMNPTAQHARIDGQNPIREGDSVTINVTGLDASNNPCNFNTDVEVTAAGQTEVRMA